MILIVVFFLFEMIKFIFPLYHLLIFKVLTFFILKTLLVPLNRNAFINYCLGHCILLNIYFSSLYY